MGSLPPELMIWPMVFFLKITPSVGSPPFFSFFQNDLHGTRTGNLSFPLKGEERHFLSFERKLPFFFLFFLLLYPSQRKEKKRKGNFPFLFLLLYPSLLKRKGKGHFFSSFLFLPSFSFSVSFLSFLPFLSFPFKGKDNIR